jgi:hypothetical protein
MVFGDHVAKSKLVEQLTLVTSSDGPSRIDLAEIPVNRTESQLNC